jgi:hypothetical protein
MNMTIEPGQELDKLIQEKVFGSLTEKLPKYSTDGSSADDVVEHLQVTKRFWFRIELHHPRGQPDKKEWTCTVTDSINLRKLSVVTRELRAHAICLAVLEAVG